MLRDQAEVRLLDFQPTQEDLRTETKRGLQCSPKTLPCKLLYDENGSSLFDAICEQPEYYPTRVETSIMETHAAEIAEAIGKDALLVELGSGTSTKTRVLLNHVQRPVAYVPVDIAREHLVRASESLQQEFPELEVLPVCADYSQPFHLPTPLRPFRQAVAYFPGSTIGNFHREDARRFLARVRRLLDGQGGLLIGVDLKKDPKVLHAAYNDAQGVTERFNKNMLNRLNRDAGTDFDAKKFQHYAYYNQNMGRIEMHLVSLEDQLVHLNGCSFGFRRGESIRTECSYKYHVEEFCILASGAGFECKRCWTDKNEYFAVFYMETV